ncbi:hypothetical protein A671_00966 [Salmonella enterica subsp. enterica serovar Dublin str. DG22]|uniref:Uncharacterized protein n=1 Tax=Salmonella enterica subsp. enterica serovar Dublin str. UC16 TaxID=1192688 RepID=M7RLW5_SALDU|nr:hypothetical protein A670_00186 [Salmonella enterica subsp. enterica serovar Dublin str. UC16]EPI74314.1 hypothetical protein A671_00966 [Salmonella enterica subsp. enterica serovar Dublin str. DG22]
MNGIIHVIPSIFGRNLLPVHGNARFHRCHKSSTCCQCRLFFHKSVINLTHNGAALITND